MKRIYIYILALLVLSVSCQRIDLPEETLTEKPDGFVGRKVEINFSTADLINVETKAIIDPSKDIQTLHLILFDENGMLVEVCEATKLGESDHGNHASGRHYTVTLTTTDKPRIIHFVANCPLDQVVYGHENSIIGNMYVDKNDRENKTKYETSYWARIEVPYILVEEKEEDGKKVNALHSTIIGKFQHVPLLRNYAEITVTDKTDDTFKFEGYTVYNIIDRGTVAPYNSNLKPEPGFQNFFYFNNKDNTNQNYTYPELINAPHHYEGHALQSAELITDVARNDDGTVKVFSSNEPFYIYERKVSVMTDEEEKWKESPPHIIIKGQFKPEGSETWNTYYYKMDLVYKIKDPETGLDSEIKYYHILRNFMYQFNLTKVHDIGYSSLDEAIAGAAGNNISGSANASKLTNVSDNNGRLWVSYTDTTLVNNNTISFKYKYIPNYYDEEGDDYLEIQNDKVRFENIEGDVIAEITGHNIESSDIDDEDSIWYGYRNVTVSVNEPVVGDVLYQVLSLKTNSANLTRDIRYTLREKFNMEVECTPKVAANMMQTVIVDIKLPIGLTEDMFPLVLKVETIGKTIAPDALANPIPVETGPSIIDLEGIKGTNSFYYVVTIPTHADYLRLSTVDNKKIYTTKWLTGIADNASTVYVDNKYFNQASDCWENYSKTFSGASILPDVVPFGIGREVSVSFTMPNNDDTPVTLKLTGLQDGAGNTTLTVNPTAGSAANVSVETSGANKVVTISGLTTTTISDPVSVYIDAEGYKDESLKAERIINQFGVTGAGLGFNPGTITGEDDLRNLPVEFKFTVPVYYDNMEVNVTLDGLIPADDDPNGLREVEGRSAIKTFAFMPGNAETYTLKLKTINKEACVCSLTLEAENYYYETRTCQVSQMEVQYNFSNISVPTSIAQGSGKDVKIEFVLDSSDPNRAGKSIDVDLVGMTVNGEIKADANGKVSFTAKTTDETGQLSITFSAAGYTPVTRTIERTKAVTYSGTDIGFSYQFSRGTPNNNVSNVDISITSITIDDDASGISYSKGANNSYTRWNPTRTLNIHLSSIKIEKEGISEDTVLTFKVKIANNNVQFTQKISDLGLELQ